MDLNKITIKTSIVIGDVTNAVEKDADFQLSKDGIELKPAYGIYSRNAYFKDTEVKDNG